MGTYLYTAIITKFEAEKKAVDELDGDNTKAIDIAANAFVGNPSIFDVAIESDYYVWTLRSDILVPNLRGFLEPYYDDFYPIESQQSVCHKILQTQENLQTADAIFSWMDKNWQNCFCHDKSDEERIYVGKRVIRFYFESIRLSFEGKVMYEEMGQHLSFFKKCVRKIYASNPLGSCIVVGVK